MKKGKSHTMTALDESSSAKFELEEQQEQKPKYIALAIFRFRARRGIGVYYSLLSIAPILVGVLATLSAPSYITLISVGLLVIGILYLARYAGMKRFYQMGFVMGFFEQRNRKKGKREYRIGGLLYEARTVFVTLLPLVAATVFVITGSAILGSALLVSFVAYVVGYLFFSRQAPESVLSWRIEDWLAAVLPPSLLLLYFFQVISTTPYLISLILFFLLAGVKSSYEAPQELVRALDKEDSFGRDSFSPPSRKRDDAASLSELASGGVLSSFTRVGIMLALLGVEQITFTDLMFAVKVSKSTLNHSVNALANAGYVIVRKGFKTAGGPRTFIQITKEGKKIIRNHLENMQTLASKFLS